MNHRKPGLRILEGLLNVVDAVSRCKRFDRGRTVKLAHVEFETEPLTDGGMHPHGQKGISSHTEEAVVATNAAIPFLPNNLFEFMKMTPL